MSRIEDNTGLVGIQPFKEVIVAGMDFVGKYTKALYAKSGRFIGWESFDGLKLFTPPVVKMNNGKVVQANFEQRISEEVKWTAEVKAGKSNVHVETDKKFDYRTMDHRTSSN